MPRAAVLLFAAAASVAALAGCGGGTTTVTLTAAAPATTAAPPATTSGATTAPPATTPTGANLEACVELETNIRIVSQLVAVSAQEVTHSIHPEQLAKRTGDTRRNLLLAASVLQAIDTPGTLLRARGELLSGLRDFAADFGRAPRAVQRNDLQAASQALVDRPALAKVTEATRAIDRACGG
jgi:ABC-type uncharacterized transport system auxiliary subunit